jgi:CMP-N,N'-diacetyllegionaminic acid synthase
MIRNKKLLAIIPARGGSKRLPRKNILDFEGKPMIAWSIEAGLKSKYVDRVVVSTDSQEIADVSVRYGADVPFFRPLELATDHAKSIDVIRYTITHLEENRDFYEYIILLQPTSPLRTAQHIDEAVEYLLAKKANSVISVTEVGCSPFWSNTLPKDGSMKGFLETKIIDKRSQDLEKYFGLNGAIYICKVERLLEEKSLFLKDNVFAYVMSKEDSVDIDDKFDFIVAKAIHNQRS